MWMNKSMKTFQFTILNYEDFKEAVEIVDGKPYNIPFARALYVNVPYMKKLDQYLPQKICFSYDVTEAEHCPHFEILKEGLIRKAYQEYLNTASGVHGKIKIFRGLESWANHN